jgi:hypothetical protein
MAGDLKITAKVDVSGPLADGTAAKVTGKWASNTAAALGDEGLALLRAVNMDKTGRARGGFQANLKVLQKGPTAQIPGPMIRGVTWAPWLEGTSKRNSAAKFKGYKLFRKARTALNKKAPQIGQQELDKLMPELGGD